MFIAYIVLAILLAALAIFSAIAKLRRNPRLIEGINGTIGVPMRWIPALAACEIAGAIGILIGIFWPPLGIAAAIGLVIYFIGAIVAHLRVKDFKGVGNPVLPLVLAVATLVLILQSL